MEKDFHLDVSKDAVTLYITVYTQDGICVANINPRMIGRNMIGLRDVDGHYFVRERLEASRTKQSAGRTSASSVR